MHKTLTLLPVLLSAALSAQSTSLTDLRALGNYGMFAVQGNTRSLEFLADGKLVPASMTVSGFLPNAGGVDTIVGWRRSAGGGVSVDISEQGAVSVGARQAAFTGGSTKTGRTTARIVPGPHDLLLRIAGRAGSRGLLEIWSSGVLDRGVKVAYGVDVGNDSRFDYRSDLPRFATRIVPVMIPRTGTLMVRLRSEVVVQQAPGGSLRYKTGMSVRFTPAPHCAVRSYGESCGPRLTGVISGSPRSKFGLTVSNSTRNSRGLLVLGTREVRVRIPGARCPLLTNPVVVAPYRTDSQGRAQWSFQIPPMALDIKMQAADLAGGVIKPSNGVHVLCLR